MNIDLSNKTALVTGAAQGIGLAIVEAFAKANAKVVLTDVDDEKIQKQVKRLKGLGHNLTGSVMDITDAAMIKKVLSEYSPDILVCNAGAANDKKAEDHSNEDWDKMIALNLNGTFYCCRDAGIEMIKKKSGVIINIASISGIAVVSPEHHVGYDVAKAGVLQLTRTLGVNWAKYGIRVNSISPGYTNTKILEEVGSESPETLETWKSQIPIGSFNEPSDIGKTAVFLASDMAGAINATNLMVDGGYSAAK